MRIQIFSDLHLESEDFSPQPHPQAEVLILAGDIDSSWAGLQLFGDWPVPVLMVAGNHEFDGRDIDEAWGRLRRLCEQAGIRLLERECIEMIDDQQRRIRFLGTTRWCDFDVFGADQRDKAMRAAKYFVKVMRATRHGTAFDPAAVREESLACRAWLQTQLQQPSTADATVVITHYAPSLRSADPRYGAQPTTASFCNADDELMALADVWIHGHLHVRQDYRQARCRVISQARGLAVKGESEGYEPDRLFLI